MDRLKRLQDVRYPGLCVPLLFFSSSRALALYLSLSLLLLSLCVSSSVSLYIFLSLSISVPIMRNVFPAALHAAFLHRRSPVSLALSLPLSDSLSLSPSSCPSLFFFLFLVSLFLNLCSLFLTLWRILSVLCLPSATVLFWRLVPSFSSSPSLPYHSPTSSFLSPFFSFFFLIPFRDPCAVCRCSHCPSATEPFIFRAGFLFWGGFERRKFSKEARRHPREVEEVMKGMNVCHNALLFCG